ncbi:MAG TPA: adenosylmethionine decarboxylase [Phycisphaerales bacterium]|nr:adenosylmethionine decarboxylase [Phycisphaerales bacterium]
MSHVGVHCLIELYGCPHEYLDDHALIQRLLREAAENAGATWLGQCSHRFEPQGVTALGLLAESHITVHTWPELGYAAADCFTCGDQAVAEDACKYLARELKATRTTLVRIPRALGLMPAEIEGINPADAHMCTHTVEVEEYTDAAVHSGL